VLTLISLLALLAAFLLAVLAARRLQGWRDGEEQARLRETHTLAGNVRTHQLRSRALGESRRVWVYLPPQYSRETKRRFPVLYMQDGQNVFDGATAFIAGKEWEVDEAAEKLIREGRIEPLIVVAVDNGGERRVDEYTPTRDASVGQGGGLERSSRMLREELKPWVDTTFRTRTEPASTAIAGSSLGALAALELALRHPDVFGHAAALSISAWWDEGVLARLVDGLGSRPDVRVWLDTGTRESDRAVPQARQLRDALVRGGWREGSDLHYVEVEDGTHDEAAWARRVPDVLEFLFPASEVSAVQRARGSGSR